MKLLFKILGSLVLIVVIAVGAFLGKVALTGIPSYPTNPPDLKVEVTPERVARGKVIATQSLMQNLGALIPTLLAGVAADVIGVERVAVIIAALMIFGAAAAFLTKRTTPALTPVPRT